MLTRVFLQALFENPEFEVDKDAAEFRLLNPVLSRLDKSKAKKVAEVEEMQVGFMMFRIMIFIYSNYKHTTASSYMNSNGFF